MQLWYSRPQPLPWGPVTIAIGLFALCLVLTYVETDLFTRPLAVLALVCAAVLFVLANVLLAHKRGGASFALSSLAIALTTVGFFAARWS